MTPNKNGYHFVDIWKYIFIKSIEMSLNIVSKIPIDANSVFTSNNGLSPNTRQGITSTNDSQILRRHWVIMRQMVF